MIWIGGRLHAARAAVRRALERRAPGPILALLAAERAEGLAMLRLSPGLRLADGPAALEWLLETVRAAAGGLPLWLDAPDPAALRAGALGAGALGVRTLGVGTPDAGDDLLLGASAEPERLQALAALAAAQGAGLVVGLYDAAGLPPTVEGQLALARRAVAAAGAAGVAREHLWLEVAVLTVAGCAPYAARSVDVVRRLSRELPGVRLLAAVRNVSDRLPAPQRPALDALYLALLLGAGLDGAVLDPPAPTLRALAERLTAAAPTPEEAPLLALRAAAAAADWRAAARQARAAAGGPAPEPGIPAAPAPAAALAGALARLSGDAPSGD